MPFPRRKGIYTLQPQHARHTTTTKPSSFSGATRFKIVRKLSRRSSRNRRSIRSQSGRRRPYVDLEGMVLHELVPAQPMPNEMELNSKFALMVDELGLNRDVMQKLSLEKKWQLYLSKQKDQQFLMSIDHPQPQFYVDEVAHLNSFVTTATKDDLNFEGNLKIVKDLKTALRTQPLNFVLHFIELNGMEYLLDFLRHMNSETRNSTLHYTIMGCVKALMNNSSGRAHVLAHPTGITVIAQSLKTNNLKTKILTLEILGALCLVPGGHKKVLTSMIHFQQFACERTRFQTLIMDLSRSLDEEPDSANLQISILSFLNALINYKAGEESLEFRLHIRYELLMLGIQPILNRLNSLGIAQLDKHLEIYEYIKMEDERELTLRLQLIETVDYTNAAKMAEVLQRKTAFTSAYTHFISILYHCLLLPIDDPHYDKYWRLIDRMVQQTVIQQDHGVDPDVSPLPINIQKLVLHLLKEDEQRSIIRQMEDMKKAQDRMAGRLKRMEWDIETKTMERDLQKNNVDKLKVDLQKQQQEFYQSEENARAANRALLQATHQMEEYKARCEQLEKLLKEKNVDITELPAPVVPVVIPSVPPPAPPPPPPPSAIPPPPPPAPGLINSGFATLRPRKKNVPKPKNPLKSLNWVKLNDSEIQGTVWANLDDTKIYGSLNLDDLENSFHQKSARDSMAYSTLPRKEQPKQLSFIDSKRAQNCTILLTRLKLSNEAIRSTVLTMDEENKLGKDMIEQLLKFVPKKAEIDELQNHIHEAGKFSRADQFMLCVSEVSRYHERLKALYFKKTFKERMGEVCPQIQDILAACHELMMSKKLLKLLEIVLALGNYMNRGSRGNAAGFKLASLNKMVDTKSTKDSNMTLMHFLVQTLESKFPDLMTVEFELPHVRKAAKIELLELERDFRNLQTELQDMKDELDYHRKCPSGNEEDKFVEAVEDFSTYAAVEIRKADLMLKQMKEQFQKALQFFGEDPTTTTTDKFLGVFLVFLKSFDDAQVQLITNRKKKADEEKRKKQEEDRKFATLKRREKREKNSLSHYLQLVDSDRSVGDGNLDELIDKLKSGDLWHVMGGAQRRHRRPTSSSALLHKPWQSMGVDSNRDIVNQDSPTDSQ